MAVVNAWWCSVTKFLLFSRCLLSGFLGFLPCFLFSLQPVHVGTEELSKLQLELQSICSWYLGFIRDKMTNISDAIKNTQLMQQNKSMSENIFNPSLLYSLGGDQSFRCYYTFSQNLVTFAKNMTLTSMRLDACENKFVYTYRKVYINICMTLNRYKRNNYHCADLLVSRFCTQ